MKVTEGVRIEKEKSPSGKAQEIFNNLLAACDRLRKVIMHNKGGANQDLQKFADQINRLCDRWDR